MHDPMTVAFEIKNPFSRAKYPDSIITIWHVDPEADGSDDSCGWSFRKTTKEESEWLDKVAKDQYHQIFAKQVATKEGKDYAYICYDQDIYGVIYWMWRHFNRTANKAVWQYGKPLTNRELNYVYQLATDPVDNFQHHKITSIEQFREVIFLIYRCWKTYHRKWYQHPRWHIHHWKIQFHPLQNFRRRYFDKCEVCGERGFTGAAYSYGHGIAHEKCMGISHKPTA